MDASVLFLRAVLMLGILMLIASSAPSLTTTPKLVLPPAPEGVLIQQDVPYLDAERLEKLDLYLPADRPKDARSPAVVMIHGGGWTGGDKAEGRSFNICTTLAKAGYVCISINYILTRGECWPTDVRDCKNAVRFLRANAEKYGVDVDHIGVIGGSAGGHLALMVAYTNKVPFLEPASPYPGVSDRVNCVVDMYGITNLLTRRKTDEKGNPTGALITSSGLLPMSREEVTDTWKLASPVYHISKATPPTLILQGDADTTVDRDQSVELANKLRVCGVEHDLVLIPGIGHTFDLQTWARKPLPQDLRPVVTKFFDKHLNHK